MIPNIVNLFLFSMIGILGACALYYVHKVELKLIEGEKGRLFIEHIQGHLQEGEQVVCKICDMSVDEIYVKHKKEST